jgi:hypothetical protein
MLLEHEEDLSDSKKTLIYKGLANAFEEYAQHITMFESSTSTSVQVTEDKRSNVAPTRMLDHMGGFEKILEFIKTASAENKNTVQVEMYHCLAAAIDAYSKESAHGETEVVSKLIDSGILPDLGTAMLEGNSSSKSLPYILKPFKQFGRAPLVQQTAREKGVLGRISDLLMSNDEKVQELAVVTMDELQHDCTPNKQDFLDRGAIFMLCSIVQSRNRTIQESAINAMALAVECKNMNDLGIAEKAKEGIASSSGPKNLAPLLESSNVNVQRNATKILLALSGSPNLVPTLIQAGVVEPAVKLLTKNGVSKDIMEMVGQMICNVAITNKSVRAIVHRAGGLSIAVKMLQSKDADIRRQAVALIDIFAGDAEAQIILRDAGAVRATLECLATMQQSEVAYGTEGGGSTGSSIYATSALNKMLWSRVVSHCSAAIEGNAIKILAYALGVCSSAIEDGQGISRAVVLMRQIAGCVDAITRHGPSLGAAALGGPHKRRELADLVLALLKGLHLCQSKQDSASMAASSILIAAIGSICGASLPPVADPRNSHNLGPSYAAAAYVRSQVMNRGGSSLFMPMLAQPMVRAGQNINEIRLNALRTLLILVSDEGACGGRPQQLQLLSSMADAGAIEVIAQKLRSPDKVAGLDAFALLCGPAGRSAYGQRHEASMQGCVSSVAQCLASQSMEISGRAAAVIRDLSSDSGCWEPIKQFALPKLSQVLNMEQHLNNDEVDSVDLVVNASITIANMALLEEHCNIVLANKGVAALTSLLNVRTNNVVMEGMLKRSVTQEDDSFTVISAAMKALAALATSSEPCRTAIVREGCLTFLDHATNRKSAGPVLKVLDHSIDGGKINGKKIDLNKGLESSNNNSNSNGGGDGGADDFIQSQKQNTVQNAIALVKAIANDSRLRLALVDCQESMSIILRLPDVNGNKELKVKCTDILLNIVRDGPCAALVWNEVQTKGDFNIAFKLLSIGDATVKARACATIKSLCTPKIPGQAPRVSAKQLLEDNVASNLVGVLASAMTEIDETSRKAQDTAAECVTIMCGEPEAHAILLEAGIADVLPLVLTTLTVFAPLPGQKRRKTFALEIIKSIVAGTEKVNMWLAIAKKDSGSFEMFLNGLGSFLIKEIEDEANIVNDGIAEDVASILATLPKEIFTVDYASDMILSSNIPELLVSLLDSRKEEGLRIQSVKALVALVSNSKIAKAMCSGESVPSILKMLASNTDSKVILDLLADMLSMLINSEPLAVSKAIVDSKGISVIKQIMECPRPGKAQLSMLSIIADIATGEDGMREQLSDIVNAIVPAAEVYLEALGVITRTKKIAAVEVSKTQDEVAVKTNKKKKKKKKKKKQAVVVTQEENEEKAKVEEDANGTENGNVEAVEEIEEEEEEEAAEENSEQQQQQKLQEGEKLPIPMEDALKGLNFIACTVNRLAVLNENRENICKKAPAVVLCLINILQVTPDGVPFMKLEAIQAFGNLSLAAPNLGRDHISWKKGYESMLNVLTDTAAHSEDELLASLNALRRLISVYPHVVMKPAALLNAVAPLANIATAEGVKLASLQLLVQTLSSHAMVDRAFSGDAGLPVFLEQFVASLNILSAGTHPALAILGKGTSEVLAMHALLALQALCAHGGFRSLMLKEHRNVLQLLDSFMTSTNACIVHIAMEIKKLVGGEIEVEEGTNNSMYGNDNIDDTVVRGRGRSISNTRRPSLPYENNANKPQRELLPYELPPTPPTTGNQKKALPPAYGNTGTVSDNSAIMPPPLPPSANITFQPPPPSIQSNGVNSFQPPPNRNNTNPFQPPQQPVYVPSPGRPSNIKTVQSPMNNNYSPHTNFSMGPPQSSLMQQPVMTGRIANDRNRNSSFNNSNNRSRSDSSSSFESTLSSSQREAITTCAAMGFSRTRAIQVLTSTNWNVENAVAVLLGDDTIGGGSSNSNSSNRSASNSVSAPPGKRKLRFKVPANVKSGQTVTIQDGVSKKKFNVKIPATAKPGSTLQIFVDE